MLGDEYHQKLVEMLRTGQPQPLQIAYHPFSKTGVSQEIDMRKDAGKDYAQEFGKFDPQFKSQMPQEDEQQGGLFGGLFNMFGSK